MTATTPTVRASARRARPWVALAVLALLGAVATVLLSGSDATGGRALGPENPAPAGAKALVEVLRDEGVRVRVVSSLDQARQAAARPDTTVVVDDAGSYLVADQWSELGDAASSLVLLAPGATALDAVAPGVSAVAEVSDGVRALGCGVTSLARVDRVHAAGLAYSAAGVDPADGVDVATCVRDPDSDGSGLVVLDDGDRRVTVVGTTTALTNGTIATAGADDAAYALALLGQDDELVWYLPGVDDVPEGTGTLATLTPGWVTPVLLLLTATAVAAMVWRGRRLGPLVVERMPVVVRASETTEGRARLYERSGQRRHALDQLRIGSLGRLARLTGLSSTSSVDEVIDRVAGLVGADPRGLRHVLVDADPADDAELVRLSDSLLDLERATARAAAPS
ncbi:DUF4350 domain-containing protein [Frigoribacterium sp. ACAM 257]|uniref:DUF4350 domain-containing protein n=1 Tax=Frigoribacterium sp. ACAM 257 TaxID=2508998 RepID=UPI00174AE489|nr:DUF4350 domain-containing protein [Frigoribacterium sp. ACAM 257]